MSLIRPLTRKFHLLSYALGESDAIKRLKKRKIPDNTNYKSNKKNEQKINKDFKFSLLVSFISIPVIFCFLKYKTSKEPGRG